MPDITSFQRLAAEEATTNTAAAVVAGIELAGPQMLHHPDAPDVDLFTQVVLPGAEVKVIDRRLLNDAVAAHPRRKKGTVHVQDAASFIAYLDKHRIPATEVYADYARMALVGVINAHGESVPDDNTAGTAGHGDHRVELELMKTDAWKAWTGKDKVKMAQLDFAEHLEDNAADVITPDAATMLEIAQSFQATTSADFKSGTRLADGTVSFRFEETQDARAGQAGDLEIPTEFTIALAPFEGCDPVEVIARFRYRITNGHLSLSYALVDPSGIARQAFLDHVDAVRNAIVPPVFQGRPE